MPSQSVSAWTQAPLARTHPHRVRKTSDRRFSVELSRTGVPLNFQKLSKHSPSTSLWHFARSTPKPLSKKGPRISVLIELPSLENCQGHDRETKLQTDAVASARGVPVTILPRTSNYDRIHKETRENHIADDRPPARSTFENFSERLADGTLGAEPLSHVVSLFEEEQQELKRPEPARQYNLQLDSRLTITTKRRYISSEPTDEKGLRHKYAVLTNLWLLAQMRQPERSIYKNLYRSTLTDFLDTLLGKDNFNFYKEVDGRALISPSWSFCLSCELELRREAIRLCKEISYSTMRPEPIRTISGCFGN